MHRLPRSVWGELVVGLNLSVEAGMSVELEGLGGQELDALLIPMAHHWA